MAEIFLGVGSNLGEPAENLRQAVLRLSRILTIERVSCVYSTEPVGLRDQPFFLNVALQARTEVSPHEVLAQTSAIEDEMGRQREVPLGPRTIDIDLLLFNDRVVDEAGLMLPHPRMAERRFVLAPLAEIAPDVRPAGSNQTASELLAALPIAESVERIVVPDWPPSGRPI